MKNYMIPEDLATKVLAYLTEKPFKEVAEMVGGLSQLKEVNIVPPTTSAVPEEEGGDENVQIDKTTSQESNANDKQAEGQESNG